jgi:WD40 repeat protein
MRLSHRACKALFVLSIILFCSDAIGQDGLATMKRDADVADAITLTRLADPDYFEGGPSKGRVAEFSPDGRHFIVVLRSDVLSKNMNQYSVYLFQSSTAFRSERPTLLLRMSSSSDRLGVTQLRWLNDNRTIVFLGEHRGGESSQVYVADILTRHVSRMTHSSTPVITYNITNNGKQFVYLAKGAHETIRANNSRMAVPITGRRLQDILAGKLDTNTDQLRLFMQKGEGGAREMVTGSTLRRGPLFLSPDGHYAIVASVLAVGDLPKEWSLYPFKSDHILRPFFHILGSSAYTPFTSYLIANLRSGVITSLRDWPHVGPGSNPLVTGLADGCHQGHVYPVENCWTIVERTGLMSRCLTSSMPLRVA